MTQESVHWSQQFQQQLTEQLQLYQSLLALTQQQGEIVASEDADALLSLLNDRQRLIDRLTEINQHMAQHKERWAGEHGSLPPAQQQVIRSLVDQVQNLLEQIVTLDDHDRKQMMDRRDQVARQLGNVSKGISVNRAYGMISKAYQEPRFTDHQG